MVVLKLVMRVLKLAVLSVEGAEFIAHISGVD
jgi:hypothetical protein